MCTIASITGISGTLLTTHLKQNAEYIILNDFVFVEFALSVSKIGCGIRVTREVYEVEGLEVMFSSILLRLIPTLSDFWRVSTAGSVGSSDVRLRWCRNGGKAICLLISLHRLIVWFRKHPNLSSVGSETFFSQYLRINYVCIITSNKFILRSLKRFNC